MKENNENIIKIIIERAPVTASFLLYIRTSEINLFYNLQKNRKSIRS